MRIMPGSISISAKGKRLGRPRLDYPVEKRIAKERGKGEIGIQKIAAKFGVGTGTVQRIAQRLRKAA
jgi:Mn-dependent DtxR family transcriptional regulator